MSNKISYHHYCGELIVIVLYHELSFDTPHPPPPPPPSPCHPTLGTRRYESFFFFIFIFFFFFTPPPPPPLFCSEKNLSCKRRSRPKDFVHEKIVVVHFKNKVVTLKDFYFQNSISILFSTSLLLLD